jgi:formylglycine-generating enzyme required for sulfatase activity
MGRVRFKFVAILAAMVVAACATPPPDTPVVLTQPPKTPTAAPVVLVPAVELGAEYLYADGATLVAVPHGPFLMGHGSAENPEHTVTLSDYWIYSTEVTNSQYAICVSQGWCTEPAAEDNPAFEDTAARNLPVVGVSYDQAQTYCGFAHGVLPTEAQWEKAARGTEGQDYPWGEEAPACDLLNFDNCLSGSNNVGSYGKGKSPYGALDMAGNVYEWVADWYDALYYRDGPAGDPPGPQSGRARVIRSSGYRSNSSQAVVYARSFGAPTDHRPDLGFRCAVKDPSYFAPACSWAPSVDTAGMAAAAIDCPTISIDVEVTACRYGGGAVVTFTNDHPNDPNASFGGIVGCTLDSGKPGSFPLSYRCTQASIATLSTSCAYSGISGFSCGDEYSLDSATGVCAWSGYRTAGIDCPDGEFYDPVQHCCRVTTGHLPDFPVCPVGTVFTKIAPDRYACIPAGSIRDVPSQTQSIDPPVCPNLCALSDAACAIRNLVFCPTTCTCLAVGRKCPTQ